MRNVNGANGADQESQKPVLSPWFSLPLQNSTERVIEENEPSGFTQHYEVPNLSSMLYDFTNKDTERIQDCFRVGNFHSLRDLPKHLLPGNIAQVSQSKINENLYGARESRSYIELQKNGGFFSKFAYEGDRYDDFLEARKDEREKKQQAIVDLHQSNIFYSHPKRAVRHKH
jgi:hypothetical protein